MMANSKERQIEVLKAFASAINKVLNLDDAPKKNRFALFVFPLGERGDHISNLEREELVALLEEQLARLKETS